LEVFSKVGGGRPTAQPPGGMSHSQAWPFGFPTFGLRRNDGWTFRDKLGRGNAEKALGVSGGNPHFVFVFVDVFFL